MLDIFGGIYLVRAFFFLTKVNIRIFIEKFEIVKEYF